MTPKNAPQSNDVSRLCIPFAVVTTALILVLSAILLSYSLPSIAEGRELPSSDATSATEQAQNPTQESSSELSAELEQPQVSEKVASTVGASELREKVQAKMRENSIEAFISAAMAKVGGRYVYGGMSPAGFDCSGFVKYCMNEATGIELPRVASGQAGVGQRISLDSIERGDLLFWGSGRGIYHVGIYLGDSTYVHAAEPSKGICVDTFDFKYPSCATRVL